jgi:uncharacterized protein YodC (DUF2158 family)
MSIFTKPLNARHGARATRARQEEEAMTKPFAIGDIVTLRSGGRKMTITEINDGKIVAYSWDAKEVEPRVFILHPHTLVPAALASDDLSAAQTNSEKR